MKIRVLLIKQVEEDIKKTDAEIKYLLYRRKLMLIRLKELQLLENLPSSQKQVKVSLNSNESEL